MKTSVSNSVCYALLGASIFAIAAAGNANADRNGAPIRYAQAGSPSTTTQMPAQMVQRQIAPSSVAVNGNQRVEFRYPDQPDNFFATQGSVVQMPPAQAPAAAPTLAAPNPAFDSPITFSPVDSVVSAASSAPAALPKPNPVSVLAGGVSATGMAADVATAPAKPIRIASLQTQAATSTGKPLTLSRVRANRDAAIAQESGLASVYADGFNGKPTANGEIFDETAMTAAHPSLPLPSLVQVVNEDNGREIVVRVNDRGPFDGKRIMELSPRAGSVLGLSKGNSARVKLNYLGPAPVQTNSFASNSVEDDVMPPVAAVEPSYPAPMLQAPVAAPVVQAAAQTAPTVAPTSGFFIQAGAFADIANAQQLTFAFDRTMDVKIEEARVNGGDYFRVLIGPFNSMEAAEVQRAALARAGIADGFLTRR
ncbi:MAG: septal ring lytic transglycosylase RlpA family protein [Henriciella sp.]|nr:septal ring lytic transglycosylase RlpA family protein [Henriciella sp.]